MKSVGNASHVVLAALFDLFFEKTGSTACACLLSCEAHLLVTDHHL